VIFDREKVIELGRRIVFTNVMNEDPNTGLIRHDSQRLAGVLLRWYSKAQNNLGEGELGMRKIRN
jgi:hypothetical protein